MSKAWAKGSTWKWRKARRLVLDANLINNKGRCRIGTPGVCTTMADCVDHIHGRGQCPGCAADLLSHLQAACTPCNLRKGAPTQHTNPPHTQLAHWL